MFPLPCRSMESYLIPRCSLVPILARATPKTKHQTVSIGFDEAYPLFALSTPDVGGLGWSTVEIGKVK